ncbi:MAG: hypothetical protein JJ895_16205 [Balneolaceae bacterium]|nr:hypothetical protein [Balneolaceae bacterium]
MYFAYLLLLLASIFSFRNWTDLNQLPDIYSIDGSITYAELADTTHMQKTMEHDHFVIKQNAAFTYIAIRSNSFTILNAYIIDPEFLKVFHASAALGEINYEVVEDAYQTESEAFEWIYRDPTSWGDEIHPNGVTSITDFYKRFGWMSNTYSMGSYREYEMIIDNAHFGENSQLALSFSSTIEGDRAVRFYINNEPATITGDYDSDLQLHNGNVQSSFKLAH